MIRAAALTLIASLAAAPALYAQGSTPDSENGRYTFRQQGDELLRLDGRLGHVSLCSKRGAGWACLTVPEERAALETEIARLHAENAALKRELIARGIALPKGSTAPAQGEARSNDLVIRLPSDADLDRVMDFVGKAWRKLVERVQSIQKDMDKKG
jgi:hypothetical protein